MKSVKLALIKAKLNKLQAQYDKALDNGNYNKADKIDRKMWRLSDKMDDLVCDLQYA